MSKENFTAIRQAIKTRDFVGWNGLPASCAPSDLFDDFPVDPSDRPVRPLGELFQPSVFVLLDIDGYYRPTASIRDNELVLFDGMTPDLLGGFARLRDDLGGPAARLDWFYGTLEIPNGEWVYPERGITIFLNTSTDKALHIAVYQRTDLDNYVSTLRPNLRKKLKPLSRFDEGEEIADGKSIR
ncbi:MAG: hypothetical protein OEU26_13220 [Candidatus Tectomicrobia bacterium]|nr:hypothetical protein [Candidatus Tectomicrobia bacterium]